ncbi:MAG: hypothetical protein WBB86_01430 [Candidatus Omnitrophota bacterium]
MNTEKVSKPNMRKPVIFFSVFTFILAVTLLLSFIHKGTWEKPIINAESADQLYDLLRRSFYGRRIKIGFPINEEPVYVISNEVGGSYTLSKYYVAPTGTDPEKYCVFYDHDVTGSFKETENKPVDFSAGVIILINSTARSHIINKLGIDSPTSLARSGIEFRDITGKYERNPVFTAIMLFSGVACFFTAIWLIIVIRKSRRAR